MPIIFLEALVRKVFINKKAIKIIQIAFLFREIINYPCLINYLKRVAELRVANHFIIR